MTHHCSICAVPLATGHYPLCVACWLEWQDDEDDDFDVDMLARDWPEMPSGLDGVDLFADFEITGIDHDAR